MKNTKDRQTITFRVATEFREKLNKLADKGHRSLTQEVEYLVDNAYEKEFEKSKH